MAKRKRIFILGGGASLGAHQVIHPTEEHAGFNLATLLSARPARTRGLIAAGYRDAKREMARLERVRSGGARKHRDDLEVEPAFRHEVA